MTYLVQVINPDKPYPIPEYRVSGSSIGCAANRGFREFKKERKGKKFKELTLKVIRL